MEAKSVAQALTWARQQLESMDEAAIDADILLSHVMDKSRTWLKTWPEHILSKQQFSHYQESIERRKKGEPTAYIIGEKDFWSLTLKVTRDTLIPRPETELLVELALQRIPETSDFKVADLGTGSGAIALAIAKERPQARVWALDMSEGALTVAQENAEHNKIKNVALEQGSWLSNWQHGQLDMIVSNPPYVAPNDPHLADLVYEPVTALVAEDNGLSDIYTITQQAIQHLKPNGFLLFEHGYDQGSAVREILQSAGFDQVETVKDYAGQDRVTLGKR
ncbi:peptide chain release factor N(5)-glutamine methyltransferase [Kangiella aquimarina]|uniref:Release factor glutamine methyltransferase n=1 Tax=Kangiella aquimarina TaxID=261965 RepID=A0ABZ0X3H8_9GAMM|nr:peptide chain release factor N(5)-glutamine methyltransferase [Kangiella aquimarina]WQG85080.1 peptide chain release factor N(5)-glutamine methyltransferase [Kangiella aquimarina]